jgi:hypothetical protein
MRQLLLLTGLAGLLLAAACTPDLERDVAGIAGMRVVDLTHPFDEHTVYWPTDTRGFQLVRLAHGHTEGGWFYAANAFCTAEHGGTHMDAPVHFFEGGRAVDDVPLDDLITHAVVIDVTGPAADDPDYRLSVEAVSAHEARHGPIPDGAAVRQVPGLENPANLGGSATRRIPAGGPPHEDRRRLRRPGSVRVRGGAQATSPVRLRPLKEYLSSHTWGTEVLYTQESLTIC